MSFAKALGVAYTTIDAWDLGQNLPRVDQLLQIAELLDVPIAALCYGYAGQPNPDVEPELTDHQLKLLLNEREASHEARRDFAEHVATVGRFQKITRGYLCAFLSAREAGSDAVVNAITARALTGAATSGGKPVSAGIIKQLMQAQDEATKAPIADQTRKPKPLVRNYRPKPKKRSR
jgi:transcriptional regulator with XRE-family HTH domain